MPSAARQWTRCTASTPTAPSSQALGYCLHTYAGDANPLPSFSERPYEFELRASPEDAANDVWNLLPQDKRVSLALKAIDVATKRVITLKVRNTLD